MRIPVLLLGCLVVIAEQAFGQGAFWFGNTAHSLTRMYSADGPLADSTVWAQMLVGETDLSLEPVGWPSPHMTLAPGRVNAGTLIVPGVPAYETVLVQMVAWDSRLWGISLAEVPTDQLGRTDVVPVYLVDPGLDPLGPPPFTRGAIVPIPEPSALSLMMVGGLFLWWRLRGQRQGHRMGTLSSVAYSIE